ncbi:TRAP transporter substrate-binding protein [Pseudogracilibacillus auburnensis]|uniref:Tripartite ATP-independent transporter DctP family solute receptor n=1 Tax=Pseudogracilibacillus auburnensis TaxID=1494959 RepID=A0A2V3W183_9BACI|nr:TRAP transporter substrate-binding protein [Pseudogracilibacillus auburnensis]PXW88037.1 tripartite ATP-independent transporter DctP family solute receptor [Pseudogracilibacillus auburnensis]
MKRISHYLILLVVLMIISACSNGQEKESGEGEATNTSTNEQFDLRLATVVSPPHPWIDMAEYFAEEVEKRTDGNVKVSIHHSGSLGDDETTIDEMRLGTVDFVIGGTQNAASFIPRLQVFGLAYLFDDMNHFEKAIHHESEIFSYFENEFTEKNLDIKLLALSGGGTRYLSNNKHEIATPDDLKGIKLRLPGSPIESDIWSELGALPSSLSWNEVYSGIQTGVVDGFESTLSGYTGSKLYEVAPYVSLTEHLYMATHFSVSELTYNKLPTEYQEIIDEVAIEAAEIGTEKGKEFDEEMLAELPEHNVTITEIDREEFVDILAPLHDDLAEDLDAKELLELIRTLK